MKRITVLLLVVLVASACGDDDSGGDTTVVVGDTTTSTAASATSAPASTAAPATTAAPAASGPSDCLEIWPEMLVQQIASDAYTFFDANNDRSACTYMNIPDGIALAWRVSDLAGFEASRSGASVTAEVMEVAVCDAGFVTVIQDAVLIMEGYSELQGRAYNATVSGFDLSNAQEWATALISHACGL